LNMQPIGCWLRAIRCCCARGGADGSLQTVPHGTRWYPSGDDEQQSIPQFSGTPDLKRRAPNGAEWQRTAVPTCNCVHVM
jgi:hypothetical protein